MKLFHSHIFLICVLICTTTQLVYAANLSTVIPLKDKGASTYYIDGVIEGYGNSEFMVDTGSGYTTINQDTLNILKAAGRAIYIKKLRGILADGTEKIVPVYRISKLQIGATCEISNIEAAIFPGNTRHIIGMNTLKKAGSFTFSFSPPTLTLGNCNPA